MAKSPITDLEEFKIKASILHKHLKSDDASKALAAATRLQRLPHLAELSPVQIRAQQSEVQRKHALTVIALENGFDTWADLKQSVERRARFAAYKLNKFTPLYPPQCGGFVNAWYPNHEAAYDHLTHVGGYLLPYKQHFFVCEREYIEAVGLDPDDPDWTTIGYDWAKPADQEAWTRLDAKLNAISPI